MHPETGDVCQTRPEDRTQSINVFDVLGANWDPTDKKFSSVISYRQDLLPTCKAFPKETTTDILCGSLSMCLDRTSK